MGLNITLKTRMHFPLRTAQSLRFVRHHDFRRFLYTGDRIAISFSPHPVPGIKKSRDSSSQLFCFSVSYALFCPSSSSSSCHFLPKNSVTTLISKKMTISSVHRSTRIIGCLMSSVRTKTMTETIAVITEMTL